MCYSCDVNNKTYDACLRKRLTMCASYVCELEQIIRNVECMHGMGEIWICTRVISKMHDASPKNLRAQLGDLFDWTTFDEMDNEQFAQHIATWTQTLHCQHNNHLRLWFKMLLGNVQSQSQWQFETNEPRIRYSYNKFYTPIMVTNSATKFFGDLVAQLVFQEDNWIIQIA